MGRRSNRDGTGFQKTIICVTGGFILCWAPTIFLQVSQVTGLSGSIFRTKHFCNNFKEFAKERTLVLSTWKNLFKVIIILKISIFAFPVSNAVLYSFIGSRFKRDLMKTLGSRRSDLSYRDSRATLLERISFRKSTKTSRLSFSPTRNNSHINAPTQTKTTTISSEV